MYNRIILKRSYLHVLVAGGRCCMLMDGLVSSHATVNVNVAEDLAYM